MHKGALHHHPNRMNAVTAFIMVLVCGVTVALPDASRAGYAHCNGNTFVYGGSQDPTRLAMITPLLTTVEFTAHPPTAALDASVLFPSVACVRTNPAEWRVFVHGGRRNGVVSNGTLQFDVVEGDRYFAWQWLKTTGGRGTVGAFLALNDDLDLTLMGGQCATTAGDIMPSAGPIVYALDTGAAATDPTEWITISIKVHPSQFETFPVCGSAVSRVGSDTWLVGGQGIHATTRPLLTRLNTRTMRAAVVQTVEVTETPLGGMPHLVHSTTNGKDFLFAFDSGRPLVTATLESEQVMASVHWLRSGRPFPYIVRPLSVSATGTLVCGGASNSTQRNMQVCDYVDDSAFLVAVHETVEETPVAVEAEEPADTTADCYKTAPAEADGTIQLVNDDDAESDDIANAMAEIFGGDGE